MPEEEGREERQNEVGRHLQLTPRDRRRCRVAAAVKKKDKDFHYY